MGRLLGHGHNFKLDRLVVQQQLVVSLLIDVMRGEWDLAKLHDLFDVASICAIVKIPLNKKYTR